MGPKNRTDEEPFDRQLKLTSLPKFKPTWGALNRKLRQDDDSEGGSGPFE